MAKPSEWARSLDEWRHHLELAAKLTTGNGQGPRSNAGNRPSILWYTGHSRSQHTEPVGSNVN